jgi:hypothetical protein
LTEINTAQKYIDWQSTGFCNVTVGRTCGQFVGVPAEQNGQCRVVHLSKSVRVILQKNKYLLTSCRRQVNKFLQKWGNDEDKGQRSRVCECNANFIVTDT